MKRKIGFLLLLTMIASTVSCEKKHEIVNKEDYMAYIKNAEVVANEIESETFLKFVSSDESFNLFINDYLRRHLRYDKNSIGQVPVGGSVLFNKEWESLSLMWFDATRTNIKDDRHVMMRKWIEEIPVDKYGYVWSTFDNLTPPTEGAAIYFGQGWPFPEYPQSNGKSKGWEFNEDNDNWITNSNSSRINGGLYKATSKNNEIIFESPDFRVETLYAPFLEFDIRLGGKQSNIDDIVVYWQTTDDPTWSEEKSASQKEWSTIPIEEMTSKFARRIYMPLYLHPQWLDKTITKLKITINGEGNFSADLNYVRLNYDTRHNNNINLLISAAKTYFEFTNDTEFLANNLERLRKAAMFALEHLDGKNGIMDVSYLYGHDGVPINGHGLGNGYWDILPSGPIDLYSNIYFYRAVESLAYLEEAASKLGIDANMPEVVSKDNNGKVAYTYSSKDLRELQKEIKKNITKYFWDKEKGRFFYGYNDASNITVRKKVNGEWVNFPFAKKNEKIDYGFIMFNLEAVYSGIASKEQSKKIMSWITGERIIKGEDSVGEDIYKYTFAPRSTTIKNNQNYNMGLWQGALLPFGNQVQDGGTVLWLSFYDICSRLNMYGANNAFNRFKEIQNWYEDVQKAGGEGYDFYRVYYETKAEELGTTLQGGGTAGGLGVDFEFVESSLVYASIPYGFFGLSCEEYGRLTTKPNLPDSLTYFKMENLMFNDVRYNLTVTNHSAQITNISGDANNLKLNVKLMEPKFEWELVVNGEITKDYIVKDGLISITVPFTNANVHIEPKE